MIPTEDPIRDEDRDRLIAELEEALRVRDDFLLAASHDLKTPLMTLQLNVQLLLRGFGPDGDARVLARLRSMERQVAHMSLLVNRLLAVSRGGLSVLALEEVDLAALTREVVARYQDQLRWAGCEVTVDANAPVVGRWDRARLDEVIANLLGNAMKYGAGRPVAVAVEGAGAMARLKVSDRGVGIPAAEQERIFGKFERAAESGDRPGMGLGLWIVDRVVEALGGTIHVDSVPGQGSTFTVELPIDRSISGSVD